MNILSNLEQIANIIIRPSRYSYKITDLGNRSFQIEDKTIQRQDFQLKNSRGMKIKCSLYTSQRNLKSIKKCIIYLHCNSGCRVQGLAYLKQALDQDYSYVVFDFTGSGLSQGKYVSLGFYETVDLECVYLYIKSLISQDGKIILWGRSMGAVTGLNFLLQNKHDVFFAVFDSPFKSLKDLFIQIGKQKTSFPEFILQMAYNYLKPIIQQKAGFNIEQVDLKLENNSINCPCVFIASKQDSLVPFQQIDEIFTLYKGEKEMLFIEEGHNQSRNPKIINQVFKTLKKHLQQQQIRRNLKNDHQVQKKNYYSHLGQRSVNDKLQKKELSRKKLELTIKSHSQRTLLSNMTGSVNAKVIMLRDEDLLQQRRVSNLGSIQKNGQNTIKLKIRQEQNPSIEKSINPINTNHPISVNQASLQQTPHPLLQKKPLSCLLPQKKSLKALSIEQNDLNRLSFQPDTERKALLNNKSESKLKVKRKPLQIKNFFNSQNQPKVEKQNIDEKDWKVLEQNTVRIHYQKGQKLHQCIPLGQRKLQNNIMSSREFGPKHQVAKTVPCIQPLKQSQKYQSNDTELPQKFKFSNKLKSTVSNDSVKINIQSLSNPKQKQEPHSDIKMQSHTKNKINFHDDFIREKQFLKRCESLQKVFKMQNLNDKKLNNEPVTQTYRQIKCTQRVLVKIIEKQQRKLLILNLQQNNKVETKKVKLVEKTDKTQKDQNIQRPQRKQNERSEKPKNERKTLQQIVNKSKPFVELKGIKNYRESFQGKYKTQIRK